MCLELMDNDYFKKGNEITIARYEARGNPLPPMNLEKYSPENIAATLADEVSCLSSSMMNVWRLI
jgi:hypothetical protein